MFKKFTKEADVSNHSQVKTSIQRNIRKQIQQNYPDLEKDLDFIFPKKTPIYVTKCSNRVNLVVCNKIVWFFNYYDGPYLPTLRTLHKYPNLLPHVQVDKGAISHIFKGANIMCRGLTSKGGKMEVNVEAGKPCAIFAEGKQHALAVGMMKLSTEAIRKINQDIGIETLHYLSDGLWLIPSIE